MTTIENRYQNEIYTELGVRPVVNAAATLTRLGGSLVAPPVLPAMAAAARNFVDVVELGRAVGRRLAEKTRNEAAYVSNGAAALITLGVIACIARSKGGPFVLQDLPYLDKTGEKTVIMFRSQRNPYDYAVRQVGVRIVEVGPEPAELEAAIDKRTVCVLWFAGAHFAAGALPIEQVVEIAHRSGVPVLVDAAAQIPPVSSLWHFTTEVGADGAIFSGGKGLRGPQSTGLMVGKEWLIAAARANGAPFHSLGRGMKVGKEEMLGLLAAVEWTLEQNEPELIASYEATVEKWIVGLSGLDGVTVSRGFPSEAGQPHGRAIVEIGPESGWSRDELIGALWRNDPAIAVAPDGPRAIALNPQTLEPGEDDLVLAELQRLLRTRSGKAG
ncbi:MAG TPA: aminotransferase class V-fold PLP-dependent enzyme [Pseudonocardia sp.]|jgi:L-seryl-tRNA(Ser) seleniumtransferase|uniref:aminotransferase class V-fold PLP-dependent enzyme n=1 Tax=Pseudonocardia sp. TaxID=60912 RepID=UPI002B4B7F91|nr:aminotransferase class V-fold PLP-dependent enzyme [Pseudonocardia sp.]HLU56894.1 aminotransferase class V-fold PLP-dependent enzyme [Pseudonocardia sp.]